MSRIENWNIYAFVVLIFWAKIGLVLSYTLFATLDDDDDDYDYDNNNSYDDNDDADVSH